jgi:Matrixin
MLRPPAIAAALLLASCGVAVASFLRSPPASAYCRTSTCDAGNVCDPALPTNCGTAIQWTQPCIGFDIQQDASVKVRYADADRVLLAAFQSWMNVDCGGHYPSINIQDLGPVACDQVEYNGTAGNANILIFRDTYWPHPTGQTVEAIALTTVTFDIGTGEIYDADIEVNTFQFDITVGNSNVGVDLQSVLTHESGHFLGLAHTDVIGATMYPDYTPGTTTIRDPVADDVAAMCDTYPPGRAVKDACDPIPRHGWASQCAAQQDEGTCALVPGPAPSPSRSLAALLAAAGVLACRRRRAPPAPLPRPHRPAP